MRGLTRAILALVAASATLALSACGGGPSTDEVAAWTAFSAYRQVQHHDTPVQGPRSVKEYVLGATGAYKSRYAGADSILAGKFTGAVTTSDPATGKTDVMATFSIHAPVMGQVTGAVVIDIGDAAPGVDMDKAVRGAGNAVVFLVDDSGTWRLSDGLYAICPTDKDGRLSMPLVNLASRSSYLAGVVDVGDITGLLIAGAHDPGGVLDGGNNGINDPQQSLIDKAKNLGASPRYPR
jgi:hypothetical protein